MQQLILTVIFLVIWLPTILFTTSNSSIAPPLQETALLAGPYPWKYQEREIVFNQKQPEFFLFGKIATKPASIPVTVRAGFIEWLYASSSRFKSNVQVFYTGLEGRPYVTKDVLENDAGLTYSIGDLRFNWVFVFSLLFCLVIPVLYVLMLMADNIVIDSPEERKRKSKNFIDLVKVIEQRAEEDPKWLKRKTIALAFLGYFVVLGSIALMIPVGLGMFGSIALLTGGNVLGLKFAFVLAIVPIGFAWNMGKSLLSMGYAYEGVEIKRKECPELFKLLDKICKKVKGPKFKRVFIDQNLNASVIRNGGVLGFFGMGPVVLTLGLPLMQSMDTKHIVGVIGHEYGHVAAKDNAWGQWIYRIRNSWLMLGERLGFDRLWYALKLNRFYDWFIAIFNAHSFALSRRCEYEADAFSARLAGKQAMAGALSSLVVFGDQYDDKFWNKIWERSDNGEGIQAVRPYTDVPKFFASLGDDSKAVTNALKQQTDYTATHPSISDRLSALSAEFNVLQAPGKTVSSRLLGSMEAKLIKQFNQEWQEAANENWLERQQEYKKTQDKYDDLKQKQVQDLTDDQLWELSSASSNMNDNDLFYLSNKELLRRHPESADAGLNCIWYQLIIQKDSSQLSVMEGFVKKYPEFLPNICRYAVEFLSNEGREDEAKPYYERLENWEYIRSAAEDERAVILASDEYKPHGLEADAIVDFVQYYSGHPVISNVYMVQKVVKYMPEYPCYVIAYQTKANFWNTQKSVDEKVDDFIYGSGLSSDYSFIELDSIKGMKKKLGKVQDSKVYG